jgi:hypothetical protein
MVVRTPDISLAWRLSSAGYHGKTASLFPGSCSLDGGIECQQVGLFGNPLNGRQDTRYLVGMATQFGDDGGGGYGGGNNNSYGGGNSGGNGGGNGGGGGGFDESSSSDIPW